MALAMATCLTLHGVAMADDKEENKESSSGLIASRSLTNKIFKGDGVINMLIDISGPDLKSYLSQTNGLMLLGVDVNEDASGNESSKSLGIALKQAQLSISTSAGDFTFRDFMTSTSSMLRESSNSPSSEYFTLFGQKEDNHLNGSGKFEMGHFDDVMWFENVAFDGAVKSATLSISFLPSPSSKLTGNEQFFDFSGGFEEFALLNTADAALLDAANIGVNDAPDGVTFKNGKSAVDAIAQAGANQGTNGGSTPLNPPPGAPAPPFFAVASLGLLMLWKKRNELKQTNA